MKTVIVPIYLCLAIYFFVNEMVPIFRAKDKKKFVIGYISSFKSVVDQAVALGPILLSILWYMDEDYFWCNDMYSLIIIFMWMKLLYFFKLFAGTAHLIRLIT
jgi:hypothetical protein